MYHWIFMIYLFILFVALTPGILLTLPPNSSHIIVALVHGLVFVIVWALTEKIIWQGLYKKKCTTTTSVVNK